MIEEFDHVRIKATGVTGTLVDIRDIEGFPCIVEGDLEVDGGYELYDCYLDDLEKIN